MTLKKGIGRHVLVPLKSDMRLNNGIFRSAAEALVSAMEADKIALAPNLLLLSVPSNSISRRSICACSDTERALPISLGDIILLTLETAL